MLILFKIYSIIIRADRLSRLTRQATHLLSAPSFMSVIMEIIMKEYPSQERLKELFEYREDGQLIRKIRVSNNTNAGDIAGSMDPDGYLSVRVDNIHYYVHRLIFIWHKGYNPENDIDHHPDRTRSNNRIENLREATRSCNVRNTGNFSNNTSGVKGVCWVTARSKWFSFITVTGKRKWLGYYKDFNEAVLSRLSSEQCLNWEGCDSSSPAYKYAIENKLIKR